MEKHFKGVEKKHIFRLKIIGVVFLLCITLANGCYHIIKSSPSGTDYQSQLYNINEDDIDFLYDLTYRNTRGEIISEQEIFNRIFKLTKEAEEYILLDMFLFNSYTGKVGSVYRSLASELTEVLVNKKKENPGIFIDFITDPINSVYGGSRSPEVAKLRDAGVNVIYTDLEKMRDSNLIYSPLWRLFFQWFGNADEGGILPHPFSSGETEISIRSYLTLLNFKANHRKTFLADHKGELRGIIMSANPHDGSSRHSNVAFEVSGSFASEFYFAEQAAAEFSGSVLQPLNLKEPDSQTDKTGNSIQVQLLTERKILIGLMDLIAKTAQGDRINIGVFYLTQRDIIETLLEASNRGVNIRLILDPNKDSFGREKNGIPNRQVARELVRKSDKKIQVRWYDTHGEQYHSKLAHFDFQSGKSAVMLGSANFTRRNLENYNLESDILVTGISSSRTIAEVRDYFEKIWNDERYTSDYSKYKEDSIVKNLVSRFLEFSGSATF